MIVKGVISNIQRFSTNDGPGIRTTVFFKGCNQRCFWCHNPETISSHPEIQFISSRCSLCGRCIEVCREHAQRIENGNRVFRRELCTKCGDCVACCGAKALVPVGKSLSVMEIMQEIDKDKPFYEMSGGGVTFSGGEPFLQKDFLKLLLGKCKQKGYHTAVDTAGNVPWACIEMLLDDIDLFLYDIKLINEQKHKWATGQDNRTILDNFKRLAGSNANIIVRVPVVPTVNATERELSEIAVFIKDIDRRIPVEPLPFHRMGKSKYNSIGLVYKAENIKEIAIDEFEKLKQVFISNGLNVK